MMFGTISLCGVLMFCRICVDGQQLTSGDSDGTAGAGDRLPRPSPCLADDILAALRGSLGGGGELANQSLTRFGICADPGDPSEPLLEFVKETSERNRLQILHPTAAPVSEDAESGSLRLTFDLPPSASPALTPLLLLAFESRPAAGNLRVTFSSRSLQPDKQTACVSAETLYVILSGKTSNADRTWRISAEAAPDMKQRLKELLIGGKPGSVLNAVPLLLFSGETGSDTRVAWQTSSFLCELKQFLAGVTPHSHPESPLLQLSSLQSLPPLALGRSTSEATLAALIHSPSLTVLSFGGCCSSSQVHRGELALPPPLSEELRQKLEQTVTHITEVIREEVGDEAIRRLGRLVELSAFPRKDLATGQSQYRAFLLLKALQTVSRTYTVKRGLRAIRANADTPARQKHCRLRSFTMSLERHAIDPSTADINNCQGVCSFPMANTTNHAVLLNSYIDNKRAANEAVDQRAPCCVPVAYEDLDMVLLDEAGTGTELRTLTDVVVKECGCR
ncbi:muellerian-inhibiting factor [Takifugu flavidus]|uniref:muellerian-inhibiting factor n=1 Tax=Takifugu flavidus TaxID=433684 RepID=UPI0025444BCB|nr:muellerian-inhibiting factor [Takifugu flavidus]